MNDCSAGIITVEAKSGRVSRLRSWLKFFAFATSSAAFCCSGV